MITYPNTPTIFPYDWVYELNGNKIKFSHDVNQLLRKNDSVTPEGRWLNGIGAGRKDELQTLIANCLDTLAPVAVISLKSNQHDEKSHGSAELTSVSVKAGLKRVKRTHSTSTTSLALHFEELEKRLHFLADRISTCFKQELSHKKVIYNASKNRIEFK